MVPWKFEKTCKRDDSEVWDGGSKWQTTGDEKENINKVKKFFQSLSDKYAFDEHFLYQLLEIKEEGQNKKF